jgi:hypothetical protein
MPSATSVTKGVKGDFGWMFRLLTAVTSTLAIAALAQRAFLTWSLTAPMALILDAYNATMQVLFGWAQPYLQAALSWLGSFIGWRPTLYPHWRDVLVAMSLIGACAVRPATGFRVRIHGVVAFLITILPAALIAGLLPLQSDDLTTQPLAAVLPGVIWSITFCPLVGMAIRKHPDALVGLMLFLGAGPAMLFGLLYFTLGTTAGLGLVGISIAILALGITLLSNPPTASTGWGIIGGFLGAFCFFAIDAGLKLLMA